MENTESKKKSNWPVATRVIAAVLALVLLLQIGPFYTSKVLFKSDKYAGSEYETEADYISENDEYLSATRLKRMREITKTLGKPNNYEEYSLFASVAIADEKYAEAAKYLLRCISLCPGDHLEKSDLHVKLGAVFALDNDWAKCAEHMRRAVQLNPDNADGWLMLSESGLRIEDYAEALDAINHYGALRELDSDQYYAIAAMKLNLEDYEGAVESCNTMLEREDCNKADALLMRSQAYLLMNEFEKSLSDAKECQTLGGDISAALELQANCYEFVSNYEEALQTYETLVEMNAADEVILENAIECAYMAENYEAMIELCHMALDSSDSGVNTLEIKKWLGLSLLETEQFEESEKYLTEYLSENSSSQELHYFRGVCRMSLEKYAEAEEDFTAMIENGLMLDECLYNRAMCRMLQEKADEAAEDFQLVIERGEDEEIIKLISDLLGLDEAEKASASTSQRTRGKRLKNIQK